jgi:cell division protein FtsB
MTIEPVKKQRSFKSVAIGLTILVLLLSIFSTYSLGTDTNVIERYKAVNSDLTTNLQQANANISALQQKIQQLQAQIASDNAQIQQLNATNAKYQEQIVILQSQVANLQIQLMAANSKLQSLEQVNLVADGWWGSACLFNYCVAAYKALAIANTGTQSAYNVQITITFWSGPGGTGSQLCQTTYVVGAVAGQSVVSVNPNDLPSCSYTGSQAQSSTYYTTHT